MNTEITIPKEWYPEGDYSSHRPLLYLALRLVPKQSFYEFGMGYGSTPLLQRYCGCLHSFETDEDWALKFADGYEQLNAPNRNGYVKGLHYIWIEKDPLLWEIRDDFSNNIIFIDNKPGEIRKDLIAKHANHAQIIIAHDTQESADYVYHMKADLASFKYRLDLHIPELPTTTAVSNFIDLSPLRGEFDGFKFT